MLFTPPQPRAHRLLDGDDLTEEGSPSLGWNLHRPADTNTGSALETRRGTDARGPSLLTCSCSGASFWWRLGSCRRSSRRRTPACCKLWSPLGSAASWCPRRTCWRALGGYRERRASRFTRPEKSSTRHHRGHGNLLHSRNHFHRLLCFQTTSAVGPDGEKEKMFLSTWQIKTGLTTFN